MIKPARYIWAISSCIIALALILLPPVQNAASAATYYVATTGSNSDPGTQGQPWQTVAYAVATMVAGDTTYVRGGTYKEGLIRFRKTGTQALPIKLLNYPGEAPIIDFLDKEAFHRIEFNLDAGSQNPIGWITLEGFEIRNGHDGIRTNNLHHSIIRRNWIHDNVNQGIGGSGTQNLIDRNKVSHNGQFSTDPTSTLQHGIYVGGQAWTITNNLIYDNLGYGIQHAGAYTYDPNKYAGPEFVTSENWVIAHNTIAYQRNRAAIVEWGSTCTNARIENNIFYENGVTLASSNTQGIDFVATTSTGITIRNNLSYASGSGATAFLGSRAQEGVHYTQSGNIVNVSDPLFVNARSTLPASPNFALTAGSPAIDAGLTLDAFRVDINGTSRPKGAAFDVGAYEYDTGGDAEPPITPTGLKVR